MPTLGTLCAKCSFGHHYGSPSTSNEFLRILHFSLRELGLPEPIKLAQDCTGKKSKAWVNAGHECLPAPVLTTHCILTTYYRCKVHKVLQNNVTHVPGCTSNFIQFCTNFIHAFTTTLYLAIDIKNKGIKHGETTITIFLVLPLYLCFHFMLYILLPTFSTLQIIFWQC